MLSAPEIIDQGQFGPCATRLSLRAAKSPRTDLARRFATAAPIDQIVLSNVVVSVSPRVCCFLFLLWRFRLSSAWCFAFRRVGFLEEY